MFRYEGQVLNQLGQPVRNATVTVNIANAGLATIYSSDNLSSSTANPLTSDTVGFFYFYAADGLYDITISGTNISAVTHQGVQIFDAVGVSSSADAKWVTYNVSMNIVDVAGLSSAPAVSAVDSARFYFDIASHQLLVSQNSGSFVSLAGANHNLLSATHPDTNPASPVLGDLIYASSSPLWTKLAGNTTSTKNFLTQTGTGSASAAPAWGTIAAADLPNHDASKITTGTLALARGGTNADLSASGSATNILAQDASHVISARNLVKADQVASTVYNDQTNTFVSGGTIDLSGATSGSLKVPVAAGAAPTADGAISYDTTRAVYSVGGHLGGSSSTQNCVTPRVFSATGTSSTLDAGTIGTTETAFSSPTYSFPANCFTAGKMFRICIATQTVAPGTATSAIYKVKVGTVVIFQGPTTTSPINSTLGGGVTLILRCVSTGASGSFNTGCFQDGAGAGGHFGNNQTAQAVTIDTTVAEAISVTITFGAGTAGNTGKILMTTIEELN